MKKRLTGIAKQLFRRAGLEIRRYVPPRQPVMRQLLDLYQVDAIFDVGANIGQSGTAFRDVGFAQKIVSCEPITSLFEQLERAAADDPLWFVENVALGAEPGQAEINVSGGHAGASSLLEMTENVRTHAPGQRVVRTESIAVSTLDALLEQHYPAGDRCFLKLDVQGYEQKVLEGGKNVLDRIVGLKVEMSVVENYAGETLMTEMIPLLYDLGFRLVDLLPGWSNPTHRELYQVDGVFFRTEAAASASDDSELQKG